MKTGKIAKNAITTNRLRDKAVTGAKVNESTLGTVPSASSASSANTAESAKSAASVDGQSFTSVFEEVVEDGPEVTLAEFGGVRVSATCPGSAPEVFATNVSGGKAQLRQWSISGSEASGTGLADFNVKRVISASLYGSGGFSAVFEDGAVTTVDVSWRADSFSGGNSCGVYGSATTG